MSAPSEAQKQGRKRILIAEDDPSIADMLVRILSVRYEAHRCVDGREAVATATRTPPQLAVLDVMMPGQDGYATAVQLRALPGLKHLPIIFLTAKGGAMDVVKGIQAGARFYVTKPFKIDDLLAKVKKAIGD